MENTNEGTVTISLQRYKELEGYEKDSLNLIAEVVAPYAAKVEEFEKKIALSEATVGRLKREMIWYENLLNEKDATISNLDKWAVALQIEGEKLVRKLRALGVSVSEIYAL